MSKYSEEKGTLILPTVAVTPLRKALLAVKNEEIKQAMACAVILHKELTSKPEHKKALKEALKKSHPTQERLTIHTFMDQLLETLDPNKNKTQYRYVEPAWNHDLRRKVINKILIQDEVTKKWKIQAPKKKDFAPLPNSTLIFYTESGDGRIAIDPKKRTVQWYVDRNNHAVENARESKTGQAFFRFLEKLTWTRATGGVIRYSDEYEDESRMDHGGNVRISQALGPIGQKKRENECDIPRAWRRKMKP